VSAGDVPIARLLVALLPCAVPTAVAAFAWSSLAGPALAVLLIASAAAVLLRQLAIEWGAFLGVVPLVAAVALTAVTTSPGAAPEALLGLGGLGLLVWLGATEPVAPPIPRLVDGLVVPGLALGVALAVSTLLPVARQSVGVAAILLAVALGLVGWALLQTGDDSAAGAVPPSL
jgi:hypothetical protein